MSHRLAEIVRIRSMFSRSVNLEEDIRKLTTDDLDYLVTPLFRHMVRRVVEGIISAGGNRAWSVLGPYGTGKSAAMLALVRMLCGIPDERVRNQIKVQDPDLEQALSTLHARTGPFTPLVLTGYRGPLTPALWATIRRVAETTPDLSEEYRKAVECCDPNDSKAVTSLLVQLAETRPCLLVIDELGKFLEYAAQHPDGTDIYLLQLLAEAAARTVSHPLVVITVLHQAADRYGNYLMQSQRQELAKVQGRFEEISFQQPIEQMLRLIAAAVDLSGPEEEVSHLRSVARDLASRIWRLGLTPFQMAEAEFVNLLTSCAPLHPITALLLGPLFRKLAQNERSLFAFLTSSEPFGFQWFISRASDSNQLYPPDRLYDYIASACGTSLFSSQQGRKWAIVDSALERLRDPSETEIRVIKLVGLMGAVGELASLRPSAAVIRLALQAPDVDLAIKSLTRKSVIVYRKFLDSYRLWEGSDLDLDALMVEAAKHVTDATPLDELLADSLSFRPQVARRHSHITGTLRFFDVRYTTVAGLSREITSPFGDSDGRIIYLLLEGNDPNAAIEEAVRNLPPDQLARTVIVPLRIPSLVKAAALELKRLMWVRQETPELASDEVARRELDARIFETRQLLQKELDAVLHPRTGHLTVWRNGKQEKISGSQALNRLLSDICDEVYHEAPIIQNELINRRHPSSNAVAARRELLERMIVAQHEYQLGISGYPPHLSMYLSVLRETGLHRQLPDGTWAFCEPNSDSTMAPVWKAMKRFLEATRTRRMSLKILWDALCSPPYGLKNGVIPILLCALLLEQQLDVALYEDGSFVPELEVAVMERLSKNPERFEVRYCPLDGLRRQVFDQLRRAGLTNSVDQHLLAVVKPLVQFAARLPEYSKKTKSISPAAQAVRFQLLTAREPEVLLFESLPEALGFPTFMHSEAVSPHLAEQYALALRQAVQEIGRAYLTLLDQISLTISDAFLVSGPPSDYRPLLQERAKRIPNSLPDLRLKGLALRLADTGLDDRAWLESVGTFVVGKPPAAWSDDDRERFGVELHQIARRFLSMEALTLQLQKNSDLTSSEAGRISLTTTSGTGRECFFVVRTELKPKVLDVTQQVLALLEPFKESHGEAFQLAVLAEVIHQLVRDEENH